MRSPLQITFRHMEPSPALDTLVRELAQGLDRFSPNIIGCRVTIEAPHQHQHKCKLYAVHVELSVPQAVLVAAREHHAHQSHENAYVATRDAFRAVQRQLQDYAREHRQAMKHHEPAPHGWVSELYPAEDFGRIRGSDGRSFYFHRHSVLGTDFEHLATGMAVQFTEEVGDKGPQAFAVKVLSHEGSRG